MNLLIQTAFVASLAVSTQVCQGFQGVVYMDAITTWAESEAMTSRVISHAIEKVYSLVSLVYLSCTPRRCHPRKLAVTSDQISPPCGFFYLQNGRESQSLRFKSWKLTFSLEVILNVTFHEFDLRLSIAHCRYEHVELTDANGDTHELCGRRKLFSRLLYKSGGVSYTQVASHMTGGHFCAHYQIQDTDHQGGENTTYKHMSNYISPHNLYYSHIATRWQLWEVYHIEVEVTFSLLVSIPRGGGYVGGVGVWDGPSPSHIPLKHHSLTNHSSCSPMLDTRTCYLSTYHHVTITVDVRETGHNDVRITYEAWEVNRTRHVVAIDSDVEQQLSSDMCDDKTMCLIDLVAPDIMTFLNVTLTTLHNLGPVSHECRDGAEPYSTLTD